MAHGSGRMCILGREGGLPECPESRGAAENGGLRSSTMLEYMVGTLHVLAGVLGGMGQQG